VRRAFAALAERCANLWADGRTVITPQMATALSIPEERLWGVWPSGVNLELFAPAQKRHRWPAEDEAIRLIYVGVLNYERNLISLCKAVVAANAQGMAFELAMVGNGSEREDLEAFARQTDGCVKVVPPVPHEQVPEILAGAHVGTLPFPDEVKFRVSSPIKLMEYMAAGLPVLATRITANTDIVGGGGFAVWADGSDVESLVEALRELWSRRAELPALSREAARAAHSWTWRAAAQKLGQALKSGLAQQQAERSGV
jgi:glycosyltransferase involved in cell wall biosynthesis